MRRAPAVLVLLPVLALSACSSTQEKAARMRAEADKIVANRKGVVISGTNANVKVTGTAVLHDRNGTAAVVELRNGGTAAQANVPLGIVVSDAAGKEVYANDAPGLDPTLTSVAYLPTGKATFWVNNQVTAAGDPKTLAARLGAPRVAAVAGAIPHITLSKVKRENDTDGSFVTGLVHNRSRVPQKDLTIYCVARRGGRVVAAGRAVIELLAPDPLPKPTRFTVYFIGDPKGADLDFAVPPVSFR